MLVVLPALTTSVLVAMVRASRAAATVGVVAATLAVVSIGPVVVPLIRSIAVVRTVVWTVAVILYRAVIPSCMA